MSDDLHALAARVESLETQNRRLRRLGGLAVVVLAAGLLMGQAAKQDQPATARRIIEAESFVLKGPDGEMRGLWSVIPSGETQLTLWSKDHSVHALMDVAPSDASLTLSGEGAMPCATLHTANSGSTGLNLLDKDGKTRGRWTVNPNGVTRLALFDKNAKRCINSSVLPEGAPMLSLSDQAGKGGVELSTTPDGPLGLTLTDENGYYRGYWGLSSDRKTTFLVQFDSHGNKTFHIP